MPVYARTEISARRGARGRVEIPITVRMVETEAVALIREIAAAIGMRVTLTPIAGTEADGGEG